MATTEQATTFEAPGQPGSPVEVNEQYENFIGGHWVAPIEGEYRENLSPATGRPICEVAHSGAQDIELALRTATAAGCLNATRHGLGTGTRQEIEQLSRHVEVEPLGAGAFSAPQ